MGFNDGPAYAPFCRYARDSLSGDAPEHRFGRQECLPLCGDKLNTAIRILRDTRRVALAGTATIALTCRREFGSVSDETADVAGTDGNADDGGGQAGDEDEEDEEDDEAE